MPRKLEDLTDKTFGKLTVLRYAGLQPVGTQKQSSWMCQCDCGNQVVVLNNNLKRGITTSCGCYQVERAIASNLKDLSGKEFGFLKVVRYIESRQGNSYWLCECKCGNTKVVSASNLKKSKSCGCKQGNLIHGEWSKGEANYSRFRRRDPLRKLKHNVSCSIRGAIRAKGGSKVGHRTFDHLPYTIQELKSHLEGLFEPWMNWDNYGGRSNDERRTWHIDHVVPHCEFDYKSMDDGVLLECWSLDNLKPMEKKANMSKGKKTYPAQSLGQVPVWSQKSEIRINGRKRTSQSNENAGHVQALS